MIGLGNVDNTADKDKPVSDATVGMFTVVTGAVDILLAKKADKSDPIFTGTVSGVSKAMVGLGNVDNTADADKQISSRTQEALDTKAPLASPTFTGTVGGISKSMVGLGNVDNTSDSSKQI